MEEKNKVIWKGPQLWIIIILCIVLVIIVGMQICAYKNGYGNIISMMKNEKNEVFADKKIATSREEENNLELEDNEVVSEKENADNEVIDTQKQENEKMQTQAQEIDFDLMNEEAVSRYVIKEEEQLKTELHGDYYTYIDSWDNKYNIKKIENVKAEFCLESNDGTSWLYKCTISYIDNNNNKKSFDVAVINTVNTENVCIEGTFDNYTGTTIFVKEFTDLYYYGDSKVEDDNVKYEITFIDEVYATIKATKNGQTVTKEIKMGAAIAKVGNMTLPTIGEVAYIAETGGESYMINFYQLVNGKIEELGNINCGADTVKEATYEVSAKGEATVVITANAKGKTIKAEFEMEAQIDKTEIIDVLDLGKVVLVAETGGEYYAFKVYRLSQDYVTGEIQNIIEIGKINYLF